MKLYIFNPENDMALANGQAGYTPPANIRQYRQDNWKLPYQWASDDDVVWDGQSNLGHLFRKTDSSVVSEIQICPWGWSPAIVRQLEQAGVPRELMPSNEELEYLRHLSSRNNTVTIQQELGIDAKVCNSIQDIQECQRQWGELILKSPWSSSGKGIMFTSLPVWERWAGNVLRLQHSVIAERLLPRQQDFALEFEMTPEGVRYLGLSVFNTDEFGRYQGNIHGTEQEKLKHLGIKVFPTITGGDWQGLIDWYSRRLSAFRYQGPVGIDMMVLQDGSICPCIEINWRMTMGMVSLFLH